MTELAKDVAAIDVTDLLTRYGFDLGGSTLDRLVSTWLNCYPTQWVRLAVIEALYQGRYKAISVEQILNLWQRRGKSLYRFNHEFERVICGRFSYTQFSTIAPRYTAPSRTAPSRSVSNAVPPGASVPQVPNPALSNQSVSKSASLEPTPEVSAPQPALPQVETESNPESIVVPDPVPANDSTNETVTSSRPPVEVLSEPDTSEASSVSSQTSGSPVTTFQPADDLALEPLVMLSTARSASQHQPIHHFVPSSQSSDFYAKLKAVAQTAVAGNGE